MKNRTFFLTILLGITSIYILAGCNPSADFPSPNDSATSIPHPSNSPTPQTPTATFTPSRTPWPPTPTKTQTVTPTPTATLAPEGPHWMFDASGNRGTGSFVITNADGKGRQVIELPDGGFQYRLQNSVSPDGEWLTFFTGSMDEPYDLALNLLSLSSGEITAITKLFSNGYPESLEVVADTLYFGSEFPLHWSTLEWNIDDCLIFSPSWSPDGQSLAFAGQMDGPSFDVYLYELATGEIIRKTDDLQVACSTFWSPQGDWLLYETIVPGMTYTQSALHAIKPDRKLTSNPASLESGYWWQKGGWLSDYDFLIIEQGDGGDPYNIHTVNMQTGQATSIWPDSYFAYAYDPVNQIFIVTGIPDELQTPTSDSLVVTTYMISVDGSRQNLEHYFPYQFIFRGSENTRFIGFDSTGIMAIDKDGNTNVVSQWTHASGSVSPDHQWLVIYKDVGFQLYDSQDTLVLEYRGMDVSDILWRPDSQGFFLIGDGGFYYMYLLASEPVVVDICNGIPDCWVYLRNLAWLP